MSGYTDAQVWTIILALGLGTYAIRFSFLGLIGRRRLAGWLLRHLRYAPMAVIPALIAPLVLWPEATQGETDPARLAAAATTLIAGAILRKTLAAIGVGAVTLVAGLWLAGQFG